MFRLKLTITFGLAIVLLAFLASQLVANAEEAAERDLVARVERSHVAWERSKQLRDLELKDVAAALARSELAAYLGFLQDRRKDMLAVEADAYRIFPPPNDAAILEQRERHIREDQGKFLADVAGDLADRLERLRGPNAWAEKTRAATVAEFEKTIAICESAGVNNCVFRLSYFPLAALVRKIRADNPYGVVPDLVVLADWRDIGVADADRDDWSDDDKFAGDFPIVREVKREGSILRDIIKYRDGKTYFVTAAPIFEKGEYRGSVLVGVMIDADVTRDDASLTGLSVGYLDGRDFFRSDLADDEASEVRHNLPPQTDEKRVQTIDTPTIVAQLVPVTGNLTQNDVRAVLVARKDDVTGSLANARRWIWIGAAVLFVLGIVAMALSSWIFMKPYVQIDAGIYEVSGGNRTYVWKDDYREEVWASLANSLNGMVASLTGRGDEMQPADAWAENLMEETSDSEPAQRDAG
ncbi:MAG: hypothetical protein H6745_14595 [Deltaproteobacteria bacterium]|nr:hypothetical protein [Deltaproteobacteria bacterium]